MIDLHLHSTYSDGKLKPAEIVKKLVKKGIKIASLTDHDNIDGVREFNGAAKERGIVSVNGVEITAYYRGIGLHILGLGIDIKNKSLLKIFKRQAEERRNIFLKTVKLFKKAGFFINKRKFNALKQVSLLTKPHIFDLIFSTQKNQEILEKKFNFNKHLTSERAPQSIFIDMFMSLPGQLAYVKKNGRSCSEVIKAIHKAGGLAVLAHPGIEEIEFREKGIDIQKVIKELVRFGLDGLEVFSVALEKRKKIDFFHKIAQKYKLLETVGSDDHDGSRIEKVKAPFGALKNLYNAWNFTAFFRNS